MKRIGLLFFLPLVFIISCVSGPKTEEPAPPAPPIQTVQPAVEIPAVQPQVQVQSAPQPEPPPQPVNVSEPEAAPQAAEKPEEIPEEHVFSPESITEEKFTTTMSDLQALVGDLNRIIRARNYNAWTGFLSDSHLKEISSSAFLEDRTEELYKRDQIVATNLGRDPRRVSKKILRTPKDYFDNVVVPSRQNDHVDDIEFISENRVTAYTMDTRGNRLILYDLELIDNKWKIIH